MTKLDIISDPICPWCYIGKANLERAMEAAPHHSFEINWLPFQLNPEMPAAGMDRHAYLENKFGKTDAVSFYARIEEAAGEAGLDVDFSLIEKTPNTIDAHRLIKWARNEGRQTLVVNQLFHRYFSKGQDISDHEVLLDVTVSVGMDVDLVKRLLGGDADIQDIRDQDKRAREMGITGVPTFLVDGRYAVVGAQPSSLWAEVIEELTESAKEAKA